MRSINWICEWTFFSDHIEAPFTSYLNNMLRRFAVRSAVTKHYSHILAARSFHVQQYGAIATNLPGRIAKHTTRVFHTTPPRSSNCDFGSPCDCSECREDARRPACEICRVRPTTNQSAERFTDRKGVSGYSFTSFCDICWDKHLEHEEERERETERREALHEKKIQEMLEHVRGIPSTEQVPISYCVERCMGEASVNHFHNSRRWYHRSLLNKLSQELAIVKVRNRYVCSKQRVDAMDFKLWFSWDS